MPPSGQGRSRGDARWRAWRGLLEVSSFVTERIDEDLQAQADMDIQTYDALFHAREAGEGGVRMTDLADRVLLSKAGLTALVDRLDERGLLTREPDRRDRRVKRIVLTPFGQRRFREAAAVHNATVDEWFRRHLDETDAVPVAEVLERIRAVHLGGTRRSEAG